MANRTSAQTNVFEAYNFRRTKHPLRLNLFGARQFRNLPETKAMKPIASPTVDLLLSAARESPDLESCARSFGKAISLLAGAEICFVNLHDNTRNILQCVYVELPPEMEHLRPTYTNFVFSSGSDNNRSFVEKSVINITQENRDQHSVPSQMAMDTWKLQQIVIMPLLSRAQHQVCAGSVALMIRKAPITQEKIQEIQEWLSDDVMLLYLHMNYRAISEGAADVRDVETEIDSMLEFVAETANLNKEEEIYPAMLEELIVRFDQDFGAIWIATANNLNCVANHALNPGLSWYKRWQKTCMETPYSAENARDGAVSYVFKVGQHLLLEDIPTTNRNLAMPKKDAKLVGISENLLSALVYPIRRHGKPIGVLGLYSLRKTKGISGAEVERIRYWSDFLGAVIENAKIHSRLEARSAELARSNAELASALESLRQTQEDLLRSKKLSALGAIVAAVAHELNTPIGNAVSIASTVEDDISAFEDAVAAGLRRSTLEQFIQDAKFANGMITRNLKRAARLIQDFKEIAVDKTTALRVIFNPSETIRQMVFELSQDKGSIPIELHLPAESNITCDSYLGPFCQVIQNLTSNAMLHAFHGRSSGHIWIEVDELENERVRIRVTDDGIGIPEDHLERVFDPFFTARLGKGRSGLGLYVCYNIVTSVLGGIIEVSSEVGIGTTFTVTIPMKAPIGEAVQKNGTSKG